MNNVGVLCAFVGGAVVGQEWLCCLLLKKVKIYVAALRKHFVIVDFVVVSEKLRLWWKNSLPDKINRKFDTDNLMSLPIILLSADFIGQLINDKADRNE